MSKLLNFVKVSKNKWGQIVDKSFETPIFTLTGGVYGGVIVMNHPHRADDPISERLFAGCIGSLSGMYVGYIAAPIFLTVLPVMIPVGLYSCLKGN